LEVNLGIHGSGLYWETKLDVKNSASTGQDKLFLSKTLQTIYTENKDFCSSVALQSRNKSNVSKTLRHFA